MNINFTPRSWGSVLALGTTLLLVPLFSMGSSAQAQNRRRNSTTIYRNGRTVTRTYRRSPYSPYLRPYRNPALNRNRNRSYTYGRNRPSYNYNRPYNYNGNNAGRYTTRRRYYTAPNGHTYYRTYR